MIDASISSRRSMSPFREGRLSAIQSRVLDALAREACLGALALSSVIGEWGRNDVVLALRNLRRSGAVVCEGSKRAAVYRLSSRVVAA